MTLYKSAVKALPIGLHLLSTVAMANIQEPLQVTSNLKDPSLFSSSKVLSKLPGTDFTKVLEEGGFTIKGGLKASLTSDMPLSTKSLSNAFQLDISGINLEIASVVNDWSTAHLKLSYDNAPADSRQLGKSQVSVDRAALLFFGQYSKSTPYFMISQEALPFAKSDSKLLEGSIANTLGKIKARAATLGITQEISEHAEVTASVFAFNGDIKPTQDATAAIRNGGADINYLHKSSEAGLNWELKVGAGYIYNLADSNRMQSNGNKDETFGGFSKKNSTQVMNEAVSGASARTSLTMGPISIRGEYVTAITPFCYSEFEQLSNTPTPPSSIEIDIKTPTDDLRGAQPMAWHIEASYQFKDLKEKFGSFSDAMTFTLGYGGSKDALALLLPKHFVAGAISTQLSKEVSFDIEYRHMFDYPVGVKSNKINGTGKQSYLLKAQVSVSF